LWLFFEAAHWAVFRGWAEPTTFGPYGLMPVSVFVVYTPRDKEELEVCSILFSESYRFCLPPWLIPSSDRDCWGGIDRCFGGHADPSRHPSGFAYQDKKET